MITRLQRLGQFDTAAHGDFVAKAQDVVSQASRVIEDVETQRRNPSHEILEGRLNGIALDCNPLSARRQLRQYARQLDDDARIACASQTSKASTASTLGRSDASAVQDSPRSALPNTPPPVVPK
jgi:hypothetical protein